MTAFADLLLHPGLDKHPAPGLATAVAEVPATLALLQWLVAHHAPQGIPGVHCQRLWNPLAGTYTYHTLVTVEGVHPPVLAAVSDLFFNAYALPQHGWYSQFVCGEMYPLDDADTATKHQLGQGYFDFGVGALRCYHTLFSRISPDANTRAVVLRTVASDAIASLMVPLRPGKQVYLLPPTGDVFTLEGTTLRWHHICTTTGVGLLPGALDRHVMNLLRACGLDTKERQTYMTEGEAFGRFVRGLG